MNMKKILTITILMIFVVGMCIGAAEATHTFQKGKYKMKVTDKQYNKLKKSSPTQHYHIYKKVGTKTYTKKYIKTVKSETFRRYYDKNGYYKGCDIITHHKGYWSKINIEWVGSRHKKVINYKSDGSYYEDDITYTKWRIPKKVKKNIWMVASKHDLYGDNKIHVEVYDFKPF